LQQIDGFPEMMGFILRFLTWWRGPTVGTVLFTWFKGALVGVDEEGNRYYREKKGDRRWVFYEGDVEASRVPPEWNAWLHGTVDSPPNPAANSIKSWEKEHQPNPTGTPGAYHPPGSLTGDAQRRRATGDYEAWRPEN